MTKNVYQFDLDNKTYKGVITLDDTDKSPSGSWNIPCDCTTVKPPAEKENYIPVWDGEKWVETEDYRKKEYWLPEDKYGAPGREVTEDDTSERGKGKAHDVDHRIERIRNIHPAGDQIGRTGGKQDADDAAHAAEYHGFDQKLHQHFAGRSTDCQTHANFPCTFRDRHQHDIHDADAADKQTHCSHGS